MEAVPICLSRTLMTGLGYKEPSKRSFIQFLLCEWCASSLLPLPYLAYQVKSKSFVKFMGNKIVLALYTYDWLIPLTKGLSGVNETTYTFILWSISIIFYHKKFIQCAIIGVNASLNSQTIILLPLLLLSLISPKLTPFYIGGSRLKHLRHSYTYYFNWLDC